MVANLVRKVVIGSDIEPWAESLIHRALQDQEADKRLARAGVHLYGKASLQSSGEP